MAGLKLAAAALFWVAVLLIQQFNWGRGKEKALVLAAVLASLPPLIAWMRRRAADERGRRPYVAALAAILLVLQTGYALKELRHPSLIDAATTTLAAGRSLLSGIDPYAAAIDAAGQALTHDAGFAGYKYLPLTIIAYLPLGMPLGERGIVATNLLLHLLTVWLIFRLAGAMVNRHAGWIAALLYLALPMVPFQLFAKGITDPPAVVPMLAALLLVERNAGLAGLCLGLSLSAKLLPGALLLPCCLPATTTRRRYAAGLAVGLLPILPFALWSPSAFLDNIVLFNLMRPPDSTSWLFGAPPLAGKLAGALFVALYLAAAIRVWRRPPTSSERCGLASFLILASILLGPVAHHNYQLWWLPLFAALLGAALAMAPRRAAAS